jgi:histidyl-tRNA synthetase
LELGREFLCPECEAHFQEVKSGLESLKINYEFAPRLVRGLDYYTRTVFEVVHSGLGAQDALGAGGRYDNLVRELGGKDAGAIGFAFGIERLLLVMPQTPCAGRKNLVYIVSLGEEAKKIVLGLLDALRKSGIPSDTDYEDKSLKGAMRRADDLGARFVLIIGDDELKKGVVTLKDMESGQQKEIRQEGLAEELKKGSA